MTDSEITALSDEQVARLLGKLKTRGIRPACSIDGCRDRENSGGYCIKHLRRVQSHGNPHTVMPKGGAGGIRARLFCRDEARALRAKGLTFDQIGVQLGVTGPAIYAALRSDASQNGDAA